MQEEIYGDGVDDIHNTMNGELPGHERWGEDPAPDGSWEQMKETKTKFLVQLKDDISASPIDDRSENEGDNEMVQLNESSENQSKLFQMIDKMDRPEALNEDSLVQFRPWKITDEDKDGVEDNQKRTFWELDRFYKPAVFGVVESIHNTHHLNLPGHVQLEWEEKQSEPSDTYTLTKKNWNRYGN